MTPERWARIKDIFTEALQVDATEIDRYLDEVCGPDEELRAELARLLANHAQAGDFLSGAASEWLEPAGGMLAAGDVLGGRFRIVRLLGRGGMGEVHEAADLVLGEPVALKTLRPEIARSPRLLSRLKREVRLARKAQHPNVCRIHDFFSFATASGSEVAAVAMELIVGETLAQRLARTGPFPTEELEPIVEQIAGALDAIHANGIVHRDLKPSNVMLERRADGTMRAVLTDFGIATAAHDDASASVTGELVGTPDYMAPEQVEFGATTPQSDVYSLGVVLYECVTGRTPFPSGRALEGAIARLRGPAESPRAHAPELPERWERSILRCLETDPARRFRTGAEVAAAIGGAAIPMPGGRRRWLSRRAALGVAAAAAVAVAGAEWRRWLPLLRLPGTKPSIVVLPFDSAESDAEITAFRDSLADELIGSLTGLRGLSVIHRDSVHQVKGRLSGVREIASRLGAETVLTGTLSRSAKGLRVSARLIRASDQVYLWSQTYETDRQNLALIEADIANAATAALQRTYALAQIGGSVPERRVDAEAYALYLQGRYFSNERSAESVGKALAYFQQALSRDPQFAPAYSGIADCYIFLVDFGVLAAAEGMPKAKRAALDALNLDGALAEAHATNGQILGIWEWRWSEAESAFKRALALNPNCRSARLWYGTLLAREARFAEAIAEAREALITDPVSLGLNLYLGWFHYFSRDFAAAREQARKTLELDPRFYHAHHLLAESCGRLRRDEEALAAAQAALTLSKGGALSEITYAVTLALVERREEAIAVARKVEASRAQRNVPAGYLALAYATLNLKDEAFRWLEESCAQHETAIVVLKAYPGFDSLRGDPRYGSLLKRIGLPA